MPANAHPSLVAGQRIADEDVYLKENRYDEPKELFKFLRDLVIAAGLSPQAKLLDVGCATGEFVYFLSRELPDVEMHGLDILPSLIERAREVVPQVSFTVGDMIDAAAYPGGHFDYCVVNGVIGWMDDPWPALSSVLSWLAPGGHAFIADMFNDDAVDVVMRYRHATTAGAPWESGWNIIAKATADRFLTADGRAANWRYVPFRLPFSLARRSDPMRTWTMSTEQDANHLVNGARQLSQITVLDVQRQ